MKTQGPLSSNNFVSVRRELAARGLSGDDVRSQGAVLVADLVEATGLPAEEVVRQLDRIRAEVAWTSAPRRVVHPLAYVGALSVAAGLLVLWVRTRPTPEDIRNAEMKAWYQAPRVQPSVPVTRPTSINEAISSSVNGNLPAPPAGIRIHIVEGFKYVQSNQRGERPKAIAYDRECALITDSILALMHSLPAASSSSPTPTGRVRDEAGFTFRPIPGKAHVALEGWPGTTEFWLSSPMGPGDEKQIHEQVDQYLARAKKAESDALNIDVDPSRDVVLPPPGLHIEFAGRRMDKQDGPHLVFSDFKPAQFARRIELAVHNAFVRDHRAPIGQWSANADVDRNAPIPATSIVNISRGDFTVTFDLPTSARWSREDDRMVAENAKAVTDHITEELAKNE